MLRLPHHFEAGLRKDFDAVARADSFEAATEQLARVLCAVFSSELALVSFERRDLRGNLLATSSRGAEKLASGVRSVALEESELIRAWFRGGIHSQVVADVSERLHAVSYSAFSWPYHLSPRERGRTKGIPADYTLFIPFSDRHIVMREDEGTFFGYVALLFDEFPTLGDRAISMITTLPQFLSELVQGLTREFEATEERFNVYAHDVKQYLLLSDELLLRMHGATTELPRDSLVPRTLGQMEVALTRILSQTNSLLLADKQSAGLLRVHPIEMSLNEVVDQVVLQLSPLFEIAGVRLQCSLDTSLPASPIDPAIFPAVLCNLLENALKYSERDTTVSIETRPLGDAGVELLVRDQGMGIPEEERSHIFTRYRRGKAVEAIPGNGLGLYLVKEIVDAHGGEVVLSAECDTGTCFTVRLPHCAQTAVSAQPVSEGARI